MGMIPRPGWSLRAAEIALVLFKEWSPENGDAEEFAARRFPESSGYTVDEIAIGIDIFDQIGGVAEATDLVDMLKSLRN